MPSPIPGHTIPEFLRGPNCSLLTDIQMVLEYDASSSIGSMFREEAVVDSLRKHDEMRRFWRQFNQVFMFAESGALTAPHTDPYGMGTWITCQEGEIGVGWLSRPSEDLLRDWRTNQDECYQRGRWLYRVLRQGDTVYFGPGTVHFVFRLANSSHTLASAGYVLRKRDIDRWLEALLWQIEDAIREGSGELGLVDIVPQLLSAAQRVLIQPSDSTNEGGQQLKDACKKFVSDEKLQKSIALIGRIEQALQDLKDADQSRMESADIFEHRHADNQPATEHDANTNDRDQPETDEAEELARKADSRKQQRKKRKPAGYGSKNSMIKK